MLSSRIKRAALVLGVLELAGFATAADIDRGDPIRGKIVFQQNCAVCHATSLQGQAAAGQGPLLAGVAGRLSASLPNFSYTKALKAAGLTWDWASLDRFLAGPQSVVPGTAMVVAVTATKDRTDLIAYLATLPRPTASAIAAFDEGAAPGAPSAGDWYRDAPGVRHSTPLSSLPRPYATKAVRNAPLTIDRPANTALAVPPGFKVELFASGLSGPRLLRVAPNGDIFVAETRSGRVRVLRAPDGASAPASDSIFAAGLRAPFGIAFYPLGDDPHWVYVANLNSVVRFPYRNGDLTARGPAEVIVPLLPHGTGGHTTRDVAFSRDGRRLFISVGSGSNVAEGMPLKSPEEIRSWESGRGLGAAWGSETNRADILVTDPMGANPLRIFATGIRNGVTLAVDPATGDLWTAANERDGMGDNLVPDYITRVREGGYYGWPWYYTGNHEDPRHAGERPDLAGRTLAPDVPIQSHSAPLQMTFYTATAGPALFPAAYRSGAFAALHGSWNRSTRTGNKVIHVLFKDGVPTGEYEDFLTGFIVDNRRVWGRPVGVAVAHDGALLVTDDANDTLWRIAPK